MQNTKYRNPFPYTNRKVEEELRKWFPFIIAPRHPYNLHPGIPTIYNGAHSSRILGLRCNFFVHSTVSGLGLVSVFVYRQRCHEQGSLRGRLGVKLLSHRPMLLKHYCVHEFTCRACYDADSGLAGLWFGSSNKLSGGVNVHVIEHEQVQSLDPALSQVWICCSLLNASFTRYDRNKFVTPHTPQFTTLRPLHSN